MNHDFSHTLLVHDTDEQLVQGARAFLAEGLSSGGRLLVHSTRDRVDMLRDELGRHPRLQYLVDADPYPAPMRTLFTYQQKLAEIDPKTRLWVIGSMPAPRDTAEQGAWARYESAVNEALAAFPVHALCTYDTRTLPASMVAAGRATHPMLATDSTTTASAEYVDPSLFLSHPLAGVPEPPGAAPLLDAVLTDLDDLARCRDRVRGICQGHSALPQGAIEDFVIAVSEVAANGLVHGAPPVRLGLWPEISTVSCQVIDSGTGPLDPMSGFRYPDDSQPIGLWATRHLVDEVFISNVCGGGNRVLLTKT
jgi:anti-sigma regulatory factor (Ser/Thr protein kinase)